MTETPLYPMRFKPIFQYRIWGGRRLADIMATTLPGDDPIGEAWIMSDRDDFPSVILDGALKGTTLPALVKARKEEVLGKVAKTYDRFPLLLKFLDARTMLSVQVHPTDEQTDLLPSGERGKTEAWMVLEAEPKGKIYEGLNPGTTKESLLDHLNKPTLTEFLPSFIPKVGDGVFIPAGTVHTFGDGVVVFEVQENSDVTFRLSDWNRVDPKTGKPRELTVDKSIRSINFNQGPGKPVTPLQISQDPVHREQMFACEFFELDRVRGEKPFRVGKEGEPRVLVCVHGKGQVQFGGDSYEIGQGEVMLIPSAVGECELAPAAEMTLFEISIPVTV